MPWLHLHVGQEGKAGACCVSPITYGNVNHDSLDDIWYSETIHQIRQKFLNGESDKRCSVCLNREAAGAKSMRQETFEKFESELPLIIQNPRPIYFDIRFSNVCNLKCRTCWHGASSKWFPEAKTLYQQAANTAIIEYIEDFDKFIQAFGPSILNAKEIYLAGGEPLVTENHYKLLNYLIEHQSTDMLLRYNTNFTQLQFKSYDLLALWSKFSRVELLASLDAEETLGEFIRKDLKWKQVLENRDKIRPYNNIHFKMSPTISILNIEHLPEFYQYAIKHQLIQGDEWYINILDRPYYYNIKAIPSDKKKEITLKYETFIKNQLGLPLSVLNQFNEIIDFMNQSQLKEKHWLQFLSVSKTIDQFRNESISDILTNIKFTSN